MSNLSPNSLFHFTPEMDYLINIFKHGFYPRFCLEEVYYINDGEYKTGFNFGVPMTCFCDISLGQISHHISKYGNYGIGMTKEWAIKNKLNPIIYLSENSSLSQNFDSLLKLAQYDDVFNKDSFIAYIRNIQILFFHYLKPYSNEKNKYYDEKEWRYIPIEEHNSFVHTLTKEQMNDKVLREEENKKLEKYKLNFNLDDVKYIIVENDNDILNLIKKLRLLNSKNYTKNEIDLLITKIITVKKIKEDF